MIDRAEAGQPKAGGVVEHAPKEIRIREFLKKESIKDIHRVGSGDLAYNFMYTAESGYLIKKINVDSQDPTYKISDVEYKPGTAETQVACVARGEPSILRSVPEVPQLIVTADQALSTS